MPFMKIITDISGLSPWIRRNCDMPVGHSTQAALKKE
jgi:hypothetical protein